MADKDELFRRRQGFWLRMAREAAGLKQQGVATRVGLKTKAAISDYENGVTEVPQRRLRALAELYGWDLAIFTEPDPTAEEMARERMAQKARAAMRAADRVSGEEAEAERHVGGDSPGAEPRTRSA